MDESLLVEEVRVKRSELFFAAGLFVGEGTVVPHQNGVAIGLSMLDHAAVLRFAKAISPAAMKAKARTRPFSYRGVMVYVHPHKKGGTFARVWLGGTKAIEVCRCLSPFMYGTTKHSQMVHAFETASLLEFIEELRLERM